MHCETLLRLSIEEVNLKNWGLRLTPQQNGKILVGVGTVNGGGVESPNPTVIPTLV